MDNHRYSDTPEQRAKQNWLVNVLTEHKARTSITQDELAKALEVSRPYINQVLNKKKPATNQMIEAAEKLTGYTFDLMTELQLLQDKSGIQLKAGRATTTQVDMDSTDIATVMLKLSIYDNKVVHVGVIHE